MCLRSYPVRWHWQINYIYAKPNSYSIFSKLLICMRVLHAASKRITSSPSTAVAAAAAVSVRIYCMVHVYACNSFFRPFARAECNQCTQCCRRRCIHLCGRRQKRDLQLRLHSVRCAVCTVHVINSILISLLFYQTKVSKAEEKENRMRSVSYSLDAA